MAPAPGYREWRPSEGLARHLICTWAGRLAGVPPSRLVPRVSSAA